MHFQLRVAPLPLAVVGAHGVTDFDVPGFWVEYAACLLAPLLYQACWLANTSGVFKGFHAGWGGANGTALHRILADLELLPLRFHDNGRRHRVLDVDAAELGAHLDADADVAYLDPPYNQHPYASNYHVLNLSLIHI